MKSAFFLLGAAAAVCFTSCTTLSNRRDLYAPEPVNGPYTRMLHHGVKVTTVESSTTTVVTTTTDGKTVVPPSR